MFNMSNMEVPFIILFLSLSCFQYTEGLVECMSCKGVPEPHDCEETTFCAEHEQCATDFYITPQGHVFYDLGCKANRVCDALNTYGQGRKRGITHAQQDKTEGTKNKDAAHVKRQDMNLYICQECCNSEHCNRFGCNDPNTNKLNRTVCYSCVDVEHPSKCDTVDVCDKDKQCYTRHFISDMFEERYKLGCEEKRICDLMLKNGIVAGHPKRQIGGFDAIDLCYYCCNNNFCNKKECEKGTLTTMSTHVPKATTPLPKTTTHAPKATTHPPKATTHAPKVTTHSPTTTTHALKTTTRPPKTTTHPPKTTTYPPKTTTHPPKTTTHQPKTTTHPPKTTTHQPKTTTHAPKTTTHPPKTTTHAPRVTTHAPKPTTHSPKTTTHAPKTTTHPPKTTTHQPKTTTHAPKATTHPPKTTTHAPRVTTHAPKPTTHSPKTTTHAPKTTTHPTTRATHAPKTTTHPPKHTHAPHHTTHPPKHTHAPQQTTKPPPFACYHCEFINHVKECNYTEICQSGEDQCYLARVDGGADNDNLCFYKMGCMSSADCHTYRHKIKTDGTMKLSGTDEDIEYFDCCKDSQCNEHRIKPHPSRCFPITTIQP